MDVHIQINGRHWVRWDTGMDSSADLAADLTPDILCDDIKVSAGLVPTGTYPTGTIRIALADGEAEKSKLLLGGEIMRVDPATADRITEEIVKKSAQLLLDISTDLRRQGLFIMPFRFYFMTEKPDGSLSYPSPQAIALPADFPPHPEITAYQATSYSLSLAVRFPVRPHRLKVTATDRLPTGYSLLTFISHPLYIPDPKEMRGSIGSVKSATGGNTTGIRFAFLTTAAIKASVTAPEKYYRLTGNERTGYRTASKAAPDPDYSTYARDFGAIPIFPRDSLLAAGIDAAADTDPLDWIADWEKCGEGYLPASLPYKYRNPGSTDSAQSRFSLTSAPFRLTDSNGRSGNAIRSIRLHGLPDIPCLATLSGSMDRVHWQPLRSFDPWKESIVLAPPRIWWRLRVTSQ